MENQLKINDNLSEETLSIINDYWTLGVDGSFSLKPTFIRSKYNLTLGNLTKIIQANSSYTLVTGSCKVCGVIIKEIVTSQSSYLMAKRNNSNECEECIHEKYLQRRATENARIEEYNKRILIQRAKRVDEITEMVYDHESAMEFQQEYKLSNDEMWILLKILKLQNKKLIYNEVFNGDPREQSTWKLVNKLERCGFIRILRNQFQSVLGFSFDQSLFNLLIEKVEAKEEPIESSFQDISANINERKTPTQSEDYLNIFAFSLMKNEFKGNDRQPNYKGTFTLKKEIRLEEGVKYMYGGWINSDGSIHFKFQPIDSFVSIIEQGSFENEPDEIKEKFFNLTNDFDNSGSIPF